MRHPAILTLLAVFSLPNTANAQVTANVLERVLNVRVNAGTRNEGTATAFTLDVDGKEYLVTAKHVVTGLHDKDKIDIFTDNAWKSLNVQIFRCDDPIDIAVLIPPYQLTVNFDLSFDQTDFLYGQEAYFLGFPYGIRSPAMGVTGPYPIALIKRGTISGMISSADPKKHDEILLDGYNNPGFSGGPIVYKDLNQNGTIIKLAGVVSGFIPEVVPVMEKHPLKSPSDASDAAREQPWKIQQNADGSYFEYDDTKTYVALNTGIVIGYMIQPAIDLIRKHPQGPLARQLPGNRPVLQ